MAYRDLALSLNPLAYLDLREASGTIAADQSGTGNNGSVSGATPGAHIGPSGVPVSTAYQFHASTDAVTIISPTDYPVGNAPWTLDVWVFLTSGAALGAVASWGNLAAEGVELSLPSDTVVRAYFGHGTSTLNATVSSLLSAWHKLTLRWDGLLRTLYLDGAQIGQDAPALPPNLTSTLAVIGANSLHSAITGHIAQYLVVPSALVGPQISALWIQGGTRKVLLTRSMVSGGGSPPQGAETTNQLILPFGTDAFGTQGSGNGYQVTTTEDAVDILADGTSAIEAIPPQDMVPDQYQGAYAGGTTYTLGETVTSSAIWYRSLQSGNTGHTPASSPLWWQVVPFFFFLLTENGEQHYTTNFAWSSSAIPSSSVYAAAPPGPTTVACYWGVFGPDGTPGPGVAITIRLDNDSDIVGFPDDRLLASQKDVELTGLDGRAPFNLVPSSLLDAGRYYIVTTPGGTPLNVTVPDAGGEINTFPRWLVTAPGSLVATAASIAEPVTVLTASGPVSASCCFLLLDATSNDVAATLPAAAGFATALDFQRRDSSVHAGSLVASAGETFNGAASPFAVGPNDSGRLLSDGVNWRVL